MRLASVLLALGLAATPAVAQRLDAPPVEQVPVRAQWWNAPGIERGAMSASPWHGGFFVGPRSGQGFNPARAGAFDPGLRANPGVAGTPPAALLPPGSDVVPVESGAHLGYRYSNWTFSSTVRQAIDDPRLAATRIDFGASYGVSVAERHSITLSGGLTLGLAGAAVPSYALMGADALSGRTLRYGEPGAGFRLSWRYTLDRNLYVSTSLGYDRLYGDPGEFGGDRGTATFGTVFGYRFY
jgi:hypothetical protein